LDTQRLDLGTRSDLEPAYSIASGYTATLVVLHDCQMGKEANAAFARLCRQRRPVPKAEAIAIARDSELDRFVTVVPLLALDRVRTDDDRLLSSETIGYFPLEADPSPRRLRKAVRHAVP
jgi:hypothetical protein